MKWCYRCSPTPEFFLTLEATLDGIQFAEEGKKEMVKPGRYFIYVFVGLFLVG